MKASLCEWRSHRKKKKLGLEKRRREENKRLEKKKLEASFYTQKGNGISEIPILPLCSITGYYKKLVLV